MRNDDPRMMHHPVQGKRDWKNRAVPITVHGDGVRFSMAGNTLLTYQWAIASVLTNWGFDSIFHIASWAKVCRAYQQVHGAGNDTWDIMWDYITLGFNALFEGKHPEFDPYDEPWPANSRQAALAGNEICNGEYFGVVWVFANDKEHACNEFRQTHFNANACCTVCSADRDEFNFRNVQLDSRWRSTLAVPRVLIEREFAHKAWQIRGVSRFMDTGDWQHTVDSGTLLQLHGGCIRELTSNTGPLGGGNIDWRFSTLWEALQTKYTVGAGCRLQTLGKLSIGKPGKPFPELKCKSAVSRHLVLPMLLLLRDFGIHSEKDGHRIRVYELMYEISEIVWGQGLYLSESSALRLLEAYDLILLHYNSLIALTRDDNIYNFTTKKHYAWYLLIYGL